MLTTRRTTCGTLLVAVCWASGFCGVVGCARRDQSKSAPGGWYEQRRFLYHGIPARIRFAPANRSLARRAWAALERVGTDFNVFRSTSGLGRVNAALAAPKRRPIRLSQELADALRQALEVHRLTRGAFDVTSGPLLRLWRSAARKGRPPTAAQLSLALARVGSGKLRVTGRKLSASVAGVQLDFGGIIKGIGVDRVMALLRSGGARAALVMLGGETAAYGVSRSARRHTLGVQHPLAGLKTWTVIRDPGTGLSVATSGNRYNPIRIGGRVYYHIVDPRTGQPVDVRLLSATVAFPSVGRNGLADGLSTAAAVLGPERAIPLVERLGGQALFLLREGDRVVERKTSGWDRLVVRP